MSNGIDIKQAIKANKKTQAHLGWKRAEAIEDKEKIFEFIDDNFNYRLPESRKAWMAIINNPNPDTRNETAMLIAENYGPLVKSYYSIADDGRNVAGLFKDGNKYETFTGGYFYTRHKLDPVWNWRKSQLIRKKYRDYLLSHPEIIEKYHPVHVMLTMPHKDGKYEGKDYYAAELIKAYHELRRRPFWKKRVYAGEYGVETKISAEGLHIHTHSLVFLKQKNVNEFRAEVQNSWKKITGAQVIWVETLYIFKRDESNKWISELKKIKGEWKSVRKKFYVDAEARAINKRADLNDVQKKEAVINVYLAGIMECIKYHFKGENLFNDCDLVNTMLSNTERKRLYSRFGAFYNEKELSFNNLDDDGVLAEVTETLINPHTGEEIPSALAQLVTFYPNQQRRQPKDSAEPYALINNADGTIYNPLPVGTTIKQYMRQCLKQKYGRERPDINLADMPSIPGTEVDDDFYDDPENKMFSIVQPEF